MTSPTVLETFLWVIIPYMALAVFVLGHIWRFRRDRFGWTSRSSQIYESKLLRIGSPLFHYGIIFVFLGHVIGLGIPKSWTSAVGITDHMYHFMAITVGLGAAAATIGGLALLIYRRRTNNRVFGATTRLDKLMYLMLSVVILAGVYSTIFDSALSDYDYREGVSVWFRQFWMFQPDVNLMASAPLGFQIHVMSAILIFALWPFTRLVHVFAAPLGYITRPYIIYRSKDRQTQPERRGWERIDY
ncbi:MULTISPECIES: respiratory nitrate reductase subunit gamma [unclassified Brevibacterium]|jgi:nitrate reductase gamma subunit|uniref:respiratory nitrate reductase subunit gamma n=1 Tax=unclassified Brevibacterium TaxID=2614124 RepID=UPI001BA977FC|nr:MULTISPECIES: respiratory nitrate reductase subunit gamma [unclassified Brevibacterium]QUL79264.1 respiratory nitrate reductase subunit gamma [Brevibacterium sp. SMBL_HHYL_HB1]HJA62092.1 respiratory nitrate reductase subunit gamma [Candidatus Brevibacterium intestinavium]